MAGTKYISKVDMTRAYYQIPMQTDSRQYTSFQTPFGVYRYVRMPMGLVNGSATMQRLMDRILRGAHNYADKMQDDVLVWSNDFDVHMKDLADVLNRIRSAGLTLNAEKCHFASNNLNIFGFQVQDGKIYPDADKTKVVADLSLIHI